MIGSDGLPHDEQPHPRLWGTFPRVLGHYGRGLGLFPLEKAVHKMSGLTAARFGLAERRVLSEGAFADLAILNAEMGGEAATFDPPFAPSIGIDTVLVTGAAASRRARASVSWEGRGSIARERGGERGGQ